MNVKMQRAAFLIARGMSYSEAAKAIEVASRTVEKWMSPGAKDQTMRRFVESEKERMEGDWPEADDVCRMALGAVKRDGSPDWSARLLAARILKMQPPLDAAAAGANAGGGLVVMNIQAYRTKDGDISLQPPEDADEVIDARPQGD